MFEKIKENYKSAKVFFREKVWPKRYLVVLVLAGIGLFVYLNGYSQSKIQLDSKLQKNQKNISQAYTILELESKKIAMATNLVQLEAALKSYKSVVDSVNQIIEVDQAAVNDTQQGQGNFLRLVLMLLFIVIGIMVIPFSANWIQHLCSRLKFTQLAEKDNPYAIFVFAVSIFSATILYCWAGYLVFGMGI